MRGKPVRSSQNVARFYNVGYLVVLTKYVTFDIKYRTLIQNNTQGVELIIF